MTYFYILRRKNRKVDILAKVVKQLTQGKICVNKEYSQTYLSLTDDHAVY